MWKLVQDVVCPLNSPCRTEQGHDECGAVPAVLDSRHVKVGACVRPEWTFRMLLVKQRAFFPR